MYSKQSKLNMVLSAFLVLAYVICMYFAGNFIGAMDPGTLQTALYVAMYVVFGLLLFYATRVGEGKQIRRFSLSVLLMIVVPGLYIVLATFAPGLPLSQQVTSSAVFSVLGYIMLGYGIPYTFFSGYEMDTASAQPEEQVESIAAIDDGEEPDADAEDTAQEQAAEMDAEEENAISVAPQGDEESSEEK